MPTLGRGRVAALFFASVESRGDRVDALYQQIFGRPAEPAGRAHWIDQLATVNDVRLAVLLASSTEAMARAPFVCTTTTRITDGDDDSQGADISADGRHVVFQSYASDLVAGDTNGKADVFTFDRATGTTVRITDGNDDSYDPATSADGRHITFWSHADDLVPGDTNRAPDIFTWDRTTGATTRITDGNNGSYAPSISPDGRHIAFHSLASDLASDAGPGEPGLHTWDRTTGTTTYVASWAGFGASMSADGRYIAFDSHDPDLGADDTNGEMDLFVWDRVTATSSRISDGTDGWSYPTISADGSHVAFSSAGSMMVPGDTDDHHDVFVWTHLG